MGVTGACRRDELYKMKITDFKDLGSAVLVKVPDAKSKGARMFTITGLFYTIFKRYANLRPQHSKQSCFFLNYQKGKCTIQKVGINKFGRTGKQIAAYLKLPNPELYTGNCFRRTSATILGDSFAEVAFLRRRGGATPTVVAESLKDNYDIGNEIVASIESSANIPSTSDIKLEIMEDEDEYENQFSNSPKEIIVNNCNYILRSIL